MVSSRGVAVVGVELLGDPDENYADLLLDCFMVYLYICLGDGPKRGSSDVYCRLWSGLSQSINFSTW